MGERTRFVSTIPLSVSATVSVRVLRDGKWVATAFAGGLEPGEHVVTWDGRKRLGRALDGAYVVSVEATDVVGTSRADVPLLVDGTAPRIRVVSAMPPRIWVSEAATVTMRVNNARRVVRTTRPGPVRIPNVVRLRTLVATARDAAGNETTLRR